MYRIVCRTSEHTEYEGDKSNAVIFAALCKSNNCDYDFEVQDSEDNWQDCDYLLKEA